MRTTFKQPFTKDEQILWAKLYNRGQKGQDTEVAAWIEQYKELQQKKREIIENHK